MLVLAGLFGRSFLKTGPGLNAAAASREGSFVRSPLDDVGEAAYGAK